MRFFCNDVVKPFITERTTRRAATPNVTPRREKILKKESIPFLLSERRNRIPIFKRCIMRMMVTGSWSIGNRDLLDPKFYVGE